MKSRWLSHQGCITNTPWRENASQGKENAGSMCIIGIPEEENKDNWKQVIFNYERSFSIFNEDSCCSCSHSESATNYKINNLYFYWALI